MLRALAKRPAARFRSASELADALEQAWPSRAAFVSTTLSMLPTPRAAGALAGRLPTAARSLLPAAAVVLALLFGGARWLTLNRPVAPADAAPVLNMPTFAAFDPTSMPTGAALVAPPAATALVPATLATPAPIAPPDQPVAIPVAAPAPASSAGQAPGQPAVSNAPAKPAGNQPATGAQPPKPKPPKPEQPKPKPPKPDKPKSPKPSDKGKGGGKGK